MAEKHTPAMWESCDRGDYSDDGVVILGDDLRIAVVDREEDAAFIVRAVNSHDKLVEALKAALDVHGDQYSWGPQALDALASLQTQEEGQ